MLILPECGTSAVKRTAGRYASKMARMATDGGEAVQAVQLHRPDVEPVQAAITAYKAGLVDKRRLTYGQIRWA